MAQLKYKEFEFIHEDENCTHELKLKNDEYTVKFTKDGTTSTFKFPKDRLQTYIDLLTTAKGATS